jgi:RNase P subunit RPR2
MSDTHEITITTCKRCGTNWYHDSNSVTMQHGDKINIIKLVINHCSSCADKMDQAQKGGMYQDTRSPINRKR